MYQDLAIKTLAIAVELGLKDRLMAKRVLRRAVYQS